MAATLVQSASNSSNGAATLAVASGQGWGTPVAGNLLVITGNGDTTLTGPVGFTAGPSVVDGNGAYLWWKVAAGTETTVTMTPGSSTAPITITAMEYSGVSGTPTDVQSTSTASGVQAAVTTSVSVTGTGTSGDLFVAAACLHAYATKPATPAWTNSFVNRVTTAGTTSGGTDVITFVGDFQNAAAAAASTVCSWTNNAPDRQELLIAFKLAAGGAASIPALVMARP